MPCLINWRLRHHFHEQIWPMNLYLFMKFWCNHQLNKCSIITGALSVVYEYVASVPCCQPGGDSDGAGGAGGSLEGNTTLANEATTEWLETLFPFFFLCHYHLIKHLLMLFRLLMYEYLKTTQAVLMKCSSRKHYVCIHMYTITFLLHTGLHCMKSGFCICLSHWILYIMIGRRQTKSIVSSFW